MEQIYEIVKGKELVVHKKIVAFIEKILSTYDININHDRYKQIIYEQCTFNTDLEIKIKRYYDAYIFLLNNKKTAIMSSFLSIFYYIVKNKELNEDIGMKLASKYFLISDSDPLYKATIFHLEFYKEMKDLEEYERTLLSLMMFNYVLVKFNIPLVHMVRKEVLRYLKYRDMYLENNKKHIYDFFKNLIIKNKYQSKKFYSKLKHLTLYDIEQEILKEKERFNSDFKVKSIMVFGSFVKGDFRLDSDIDFLVIMNENLSYEDKLDKLNKLNEYLFNLFGRYVDIHEIFQTLTDSFLQETNKVKIIF